jgi:predicted kinase
LAQLIVVSGIPGTGKSLLAERAGQALGIAVLSKDVVEATLWRSGIRREQRSGWIAYDLLSALAEAVLRSGTSVIIDSVAGPESVRRQWQEIAEGAGAAFRVVECVCSDLALQRARLSDRRRDIAGWYELSWEEVEASRTSFAPWTIERLVLDAVRTPEENERALLRYLAGAHASASPR